MATGVIQYTAGSGSYLWSDDRTVSGLTKSAQYVLQTESAWPTYYASAKGISTATANSHLLFIQADATNYTRIKRIYIAQSTLAGAVNTLDVSIFRTTTAGTGGTSVSARPSDSADTNPYAGTVMTLPTAKGTEGDFLFPLQVGLTATNPMTNQYRDVWQNDDVLKPLIIGTAASGGLTIKNINAVATGKVDIWVEFVVTPWL